MFERIARTSPQNYFTSSTGLRSAFSILRRRSGSDCRFAAEEGWEAIRGSVLIDAMRIVG